MRFVFTSDLHGRAAHYQALLEVASAESVDSVLLGGDLLPNFGAVDAFLSDIFIPFLRRLEGKASAHAILGNDDPRIHEGAMRELESSGLLSYVAQRSVPAGDVFVAGYPFVPPTPFQLKDWERYDVSRHVDPGDVSPEEGVRTVPAEEGTARNSTIAGDLECLAALSPPERTVYLFHSPPYGGVLDRAALDGRSYDHAPLDVHVGSIAIKDFIAKSRPLVTLHGHIHESVRLTGEWRERRGSTHSFGGAADGQECAFVVFDTGDLEGARRIVLR